MKVLVVEDDAVVTETLALYLQQAGFEVATASDGRRGLELAGQADVSLVILDLMIPGMSGQEVCRRLRAASAVPIIMLTARTSEDDRVAGLELGADDYVPKPFSPREVVARVQALLRRAAAGPSAPPPAVAAGDLQIDLWSRQARVAGRAVTLTRTEFRLLETLARHPGRVFTREELLARVFGPDFDGTDRTVDVHITNLRRKLDPRRESQFIATVHGVGYKLAARGDGSPANEAARRRQRARVERGGGRRPRGAAERAAGVPAVRGDGAQAAGRRPIETGRRASLAPRRPLLPRRSDARC